MASSQALQPLSLHRHLRHCPRNVRCHGELYLNGGGPGWRGCQAWSEQRQQGCVLWHWRQERRGSLGVWSASRWQFWELWMTDSGSQRLGVHRICKCVCLPGADLQEQRLGV